MIHSTSRPDISDFGPVLSSLATSVPVGAACAYLTKIIDPIGGAVLLTASFFSEYVVEYCLDPINSLFKRISAVVLPIIMTIGVVFLANYKLSLIEGAAFFYISTIAIALIVPLRAPVVAFIEDLFARKRF